MFCRQEKTYITDLLYLFVVYNGGDESDTVCNAQSSSSIFVPGLKIY